MTVFYDIQT